MVRENRFWIALAAYVGIGVLSWFTLDGRIRLVTLAVLSLFAVRTVVHEKRRELEAKIEGEHSRE